MDIISRKYINEGFNSKAYILFKILTNWDCLK